MGMNHAREDRPWGGLLGERRPGNVTRYAWKVPVNLGDGDSLSWGVRPKESPNNRGFDIG